MKKIFILFVMGLFLYGCGTTTQLVIPNNNIKLKQFNNVYVELRGLGEITSTEATIGASGVVTADNYAFAKDKSASQRQLMSVNEQSKMALEKFKFELAKIGFNIVAEPKDADTHAEFSISEIRWDPLVGWIADAAIVKFINKQNNQTIAYVSADAIFITPTVNNIIKNLAVKIKKVYM